MLPFDGENDTHSLAGIEKLRDKYKDRRVLYLWTDGDGSEALFASLTKQYRQRPAGQLVLYVIQEPGASPVKMPASAPAATSPATTRSAP
jgi:hypothetical protein